MAEAGQAEGAEPIVANSEGQNSVNNASSVRRAPPVVDLRTLNTKPTGPSGSIAQTGPSYRSVVQRTIFACKVQTEDGNVDLDAAAQEFDRKIAIKAQTKFRDSKNIIRSKTVAFKGCIQFITELHLYEDASPIDLSPEDIVSCLPDAFQAEKIEVIGDGIRASMHGYKIISESEGDQLLGDGVSNGRRPQVEWMEPPVLTEGAYRPSIAIRTTERDDHPILVITEMDGRVVDNTETRSLQHDVPLSLADGSGARFGSVRLVRYDEGSISSVSSMALFAVFPESVAEELNEYYDRSVKSHRSERQRNVDRRAIVFRNVIQPLLTELKFILSCSFGEAVTTERLYGRVLENLMTFLFREGLHRCADLVSSHVGTTNRPVPKSKVGDILVPKMHERTWHRNRDMPLLKRTSRTTPTDVRASICPDRDRSDGCWLDDIDFRTYTDMQTSRTRPRWIKELFMCS